MSTPDDMPGLTEERGDAECFGGPLDGQRRPITYILPFLGGGLPAEVIVWSGHVCQLSVDRTRWEHRGEMKEKA